MKHYFLVNPIAGNGSGLSLTNKIKECFNDLNDYEIIVTSRPHEAIEITKRIAQSGEEMRIYAVGGDGTLFDVVNGAFGFDNVSIGVIPCGSGNDFVKTFGDKSIFTDIQTQINGEAVDIDLIKAEDKYSINIASMGFDAEVVNHQKKMRFLSKINGSLSYIAAVFTAFIFNLNSKFKVIADGEDLSGTFLFAIAANGKYYGGGFNPTPFANVADGNIQLLLVNEVSRLKLIKLLKKYRNGTHLDVEGLCVQRAIKHLEISSEKEMSVQLDGEVFTRKKVEFDVISNAIKFILPKLDITD